MKPPTLETPLRRSEAVALRSNLSSPIVNDDEAERRASRARASLNETPKTISDNEALTSCLRVFHENKINKNNVWTMSLIDNFSALIKRHHKSVHDFQVVGSTLEASSKIYGLRVDSVHTDVLHMATGLTALRFQKDGEGDDNDDITQADDNENNEKSEASSKTQAQKKTPKRKRAVHTVTRNKDTINAKLDTMCISEPTFAKLNTVIGDINSSQRLMNYILPTYRSELIHHSTRPFWDSNDHEEVIFNDDKQTEDIVNAKHTLMLLPGLSSFELDKDNKLRTVESGYRITDTPFEEEAKDDSLLEQSIDMAVAFDMNAETEPIGSSAVFMDTGFDAEEINGMSINDQHAIMACRGLQRQAVIMEDLRPVDSSSIHLEYSYRPLADIEQFWAGPSHWKFRRSQIKRKTLANGTEIVKKKALRKVPEPIDVMKPYNKSLFISIYSREAQKIRQVDYRKWDSKKLRLPTDCHLDKNMFDFYRFVPDIPVKISVTAPAPTELEPAAYDYGNADDKEYCSNVQNDYDRDTVGSCDNMVEPLNDQADVTVLEIPTDFEGAPERIVKIEIPFAKRAKVIDMKQLKHACLTTIQKHCTIATRLSHPDDSGSDLPISCLAAGCTTFLKVYGCLPQLLTKNMQEAISPSVVFYSILHLANDYQLRLTNVTDVSDFEIKQKEK